MASLLQTVREGGTQHPEEMFVHILRDMVQASGVLNKGSDHFLVEESDTPAMSVDIKQGYAHLRNTAGSMVYPVRLVDEDYTASISNNSSGNPRIDAIVLYIDLAASPNDAASNVAKVAVVEGTPAGSPSAPSDGDIESEIGASNPYLRLANVQVDNGETTILDADITDARVNTTWGVPGKRSVFIPASAMHPSTTAGSADSTKLEYTTNDIDLKHLAFDQSSQEHAQFGFQMPKFWDEGTLKAVFKWTASGGTNTNTVIWGIQALALGNDDAIDAAWGTAVEVTDAKIATNDMHESPETAEMTPAGTPAAGDWVQFRVYRKAASDTLDADALLLGVYLIFDTTKFDTDD